MLEIEANWDMVITSLQDICSANEALTFNNIYKGQLLTDEEDTERLTEDIDDHKANIGTALRLIETSQQNLQLIIEQLVRERKSSGKNVGGKTGGKSEPPNWRVGKATKGQGKGVVTNALKKGVRKVGRLMHISKYNASEPILIGSEIAYKLRNRHMEEWIQCEVMKVIGDGIKFEIRDPEPDENNNPGQTFKANYKEVLLIPPLAEVKDLVNYPYGTKVLARYPETTTFYPAIVVGNRKDGNVRLKFDGEEEVNKETEVERRLVLPFPEK